MKVWKIYNKSAQKVKIAIRTNNIVTIGLFLEPNQFTLAMPCITKALDAQNRKGVLEIDENFDNSYFKLKLGEVHDSGVLEKTV